MTISISGIGVGAGIKTAIGPIALLSSGDALIEPRSIPASQVETEVTRFLTAVNKASEQLHQIRHQIPSDTPPDILEFVDTHLLMLEDKAIAEAPVNTIREEGCSAEWALHLRRNQLMRVFEEMEDPYLRTRKDDLDHVVNRIHKILSGQSSEIPPNINNHIVLAEELTPADAILLHHQGALGFITEFGSSMSHTAILARSLSIPTVVGAHGATRLLHNNEQVVVDTANGVILADCDSASINFFQQRLQQEITQQQSLKNLCHIPAATLDGHELKLQANIELPEDVQSAQELCAQGIGLYRTEFLYMNRPTLPSEEEHYKAYVQVVEGLNAMPITIRTLDLGADKQCDSHPEPVASINPALSLRAIRLCLKETEIFRLQIRAILRASAHGNVSIMIPMLTNMWEARQARAFIDDELRNLEKEGIAHDPDIKIGAMIETPAAALTAGEFADYFDFLSIGTNDLIQYTLAVDRADDMVNYMFDPLHPAVLRLIKDIIDAGKSSGKPVSMCGEMAGDPRYLPLLVGMGLETFSMHPGSLLEAKQLIQKLNRKALNKAVGKILKDPDTLNLDQAVADLSPL